MFNTLKILVIILILIFVTLLFSQDCTTNDFDRFDTIYDLKLSFKQNIQRSNSKLSINNRVADIITGYVTDLYTKNPIPGLEIIAEGETYYTNSDGYYTLNKSSDSLAVFTDRYFNYYNYESPMNSGSDDIVMIPITMHAGNWTESLLPRQEELREQYSYVGHFGCESYWDFPIKIWYDQSTTRDDEIKDILVSLNLWERVTDMDLFEVVVDEPIDPPWIKFDISDNNRWFYHFGDTDFESDIISGGGIYGWRTVTTSAHELGHGFRIFHYTGDPTSIMAFSERPYGNWFYGGIVSHTDGEWVKMRQAIPPCTYVWYRQLITSSESLGKHYTLDDLKQLYPEAISGSFPEYLIKATFIIGASDTLIIEPGTIIKLNGQLKIGGVLISEGTSEEKIKFTSYNDQKGGWNRIYIIDGGSLKMEHSIVENAEAGVVAHHSLVEIKNTIFRNNWHGAFILNLYFRDISSNITNCQFLNNDIGLKIYRSTSSLINNVFTGNYIGISDYESQAIVENNIIYGNSFGIQLIRTSETVYKNNSILDNSKSSLSFLNRGSGIITLQSENFDNNWWGTTDENLISQSIYDGYDEDGTYPYVNYLPILNQPNSQTLIVPNQLNSLLLATDTDYVNIIVDSVGLNKIINCQIAGNDPNPTVKDVTVISVINLSNDSNELLVTLRETTANSGIYQGNFKFDSTNSKNVENTLFATNGDLIHVESIEDETISSEFYVDNNSDYLDIQDSSIPESFNLFQNYPNPFNASTNIKFAIPKSGRLSIKIYNILGQLVSTPINSIYYEAGTYKINLQLNQQTSGIYFYTIESKNWIDTKKMIYLK